MLDLQHATEILLYFCNEMVLIPLIIIGFLSIDKNIFGNATFLLLFTMIYNILLKTLIKIPLAAHLEKTGYAFPSGHMHSSVVFYGWLLLSYKNPLIKLSLAILIASIGFALIYKEYHNIYDIIGSVFFGVFTLLLYKLLSELKMFKSNSFLLGYIMIVISAAMIWYLDIITKLPYEVLDYLRMSFITLCGFTASWTIFAKSITKRPAFISAIVGLLCMFGIYYIAITIKQTMHIQYSFEQALIGILIPIGAAIAAKFRAS